jgi:hypothetical protein
MKKQATEAERHAMEEAAVAIVRGIYHRRLTGKIVLNCGHGFINSITAGDVVLAANGQYVMDVVPGIGNDRLGGQDARVDRDDGS